VIIEYTNFAMALMVVPRVVESLRSACVRCGRLGAEANWLDADGSGGDKSFHNNLIRRRRHYG
jgi:hypothetical protein